MTNKKKGRPNEGSPKDDFSRDHRPPAVTGQCAEVLELLRSEGAVLGFHVQTTILPAVEFRGRIRRNVALYSLGVPSWPSPGFMEGGAA